MATAPSIREIIDPAMQYGKKTLNQQIAEAEAKGDKEALARLNMAAGTQSMLTGLVTGLPDLGIAGYNWYQSNKQKNLSDLIVPFEPVKDLRTRVLEAGGVPTKATNEENDLTYNAPEYAATAFGLASLAKALWKGGRNLIQNRKFNKFLNDAVDAGDLEKADLGVLRKFAITGQGSDSPKLNAALQRLRSSEKFSEIFATLDKAAVDASLKAMAPEASKLSKTDAAKSSVAAVTARMEGIIEAKNTAGNIEFDKARGLAGDKPIVNTDNLLDAIDKMRRQYSSQTSDSAKAIVEFLNKQYDKVADVTKADTLTNTPVKVVSKPMTVNQTQSLLHEWGQKIGMDTSAIAGAGSKDIEKVYKTLFGSLSNDIRSSSKIANTANRLDDQRALVALAKGRSAVQKGYEVFDEAVAQGVPKWLQGKNINEVSFEDLMGTYKGLTPEQRGIFRGYLKDTDAEALKAIDADVYQKFIAGATKELPDGTMGIDPSKLARDWKELSKDPNTVDALSQALGTNASEFSKRMNSLFAFTRKMDLSATPEKKSLISTLAPDVGRAVGASVGYQAKQGVDLTADVWKKMTNGVSEDMLMKMLLSPEAKDFLKTSGMTKGSRTVLDSLDTLNKANYTKPAFLLASPTAQVVQPEQGMEGLSLPNDLSLPPELMDQGTDGLSLPDDLELPPELSGFPTEESMRGAANDIDTSGFTPPTMDEVQSSNPNVQMQELQRRLSLGVR